MSLIKIKRKEIQSLKETENNDSSCLICTICKKDMKNPKILPCKHSFCYECLKQEFLKKFLYMCNVCEEEFLGISSVGILRNNEFLNKLQCIMFSKSVSCNCDICCEKFAKNYCTSCKPHLCGDCLKEHNQTNVNRQHSLVRVGTPGYDKLMKDDETSMCSEHNFETDIYCQVCNQYICMKCALCKHNNHERKFVEIERKLEETKRILESRINEMKIISNEFDEQIDRIKDNIRNGKNEILSQIQTKIKDFKDDIDEYENILVNQVNDYYDEKCQSFLDSSNLEKDIITQNICSLEKLLKNLNKSTILNTAKFDQCMSLLPAVPEWNEFNFADDQIKFVASNASDFKKILGYVDVCKKNCHFFIVS